MHPLPAIRRAFLIIAAIEHLSVRILLVVVGIGVTILIARIRTLKSRRGNPAPPSDSR